MHDGSNHRTNAAAGPTAEAGSFDVVVVGAGISGLHLLYRLRGLGFSVRVLETGPAVGGTWYWNRYPGVRCDVDSLQYSYGFDAELEQQWQWTERFATGAEILRYIDHVAERFVLRPDIELDTRVASAAFDAEAARWRIDTEDGRRYVARFFVMATGCLSAARMPDIAGIERFRGAAYHTADWPHEGVDFAGMRVGVVGTGSTGIQVIPIVAQQAAHLTVFQRTPNFSTPARNAPLDEAFVRDWKAHYREHRARARFTYSGLLSELNDVRALSVDEETRRREYEARWARGGLTLRAAFNDLMVDEAANQTAAEFIRDKIRSIVTDPGVAELLCPKDHPFGSKRPCLDTGYFETFNRPNVTLVDVRAAPIRDITPYGVRTDAAAYELDAIVFATGFDAVTGALLGVDIRGRDGRSLRAHWAEGPRTYLGLMTAGFPNLFTVTGPGSPSVLTNMMVSIEQHVEWICDCLEHLRAEGAGSIEASVQAEADWTRHVEEVAGSTLYPKADSWYLGANVAGKPRVFMAYAGGVGNYRRICAEVAENGYRGFVIGSRARR